MNRFFCLILFFLHINFFFAQTLRTHTVNTRDTLESIARLYGVTSNDILALNPDIKNQLTVNVVLVIPNTIQSNGLKTTEVQDVVAYKVHRVKRQETLYSIAKKYNISVEDIKKHNQKLYDSPLQFKDKIYIPKYKNVTVAVVPKALKTYTVLPKEGKWRIASKFGISIQELEALNPGIGTILKEGQILNVPNIELTTNEDLLNESFGFYEVLPKEGFYRLNEKLGITKDSLEQLNPGLAEMGLKAGMILKVPKASLKMLDFSKEKINNLSTQQKFFEPKSVALMLPFKANSIAFDSIQLAKQQIMRDGYIRIATEFYAGVEMALDSAKRLGISTNLDVFDTQADTETVKNILRTKDFSKYDFVLGPINAQNLTIVAEELSKTNTAVISPLVKLEVNYPNLVQTIPDEAWMADKLLNYAKKDSIAHNTLIITDARNSFRASKIRAVFPNAKLLTSNSDEDGKDQYYIDFETVQRALGPGKTVVFLETESESFASNVSSMLNGLNGVSVNIGGSNTESPVKRKLSLMTTNFNKAFIGNNISNTDLSNLNFQFASVHFFKEDLTPFALSYKQRYGAYPTRYATRGFDLTLDLILRLTSFGSVFEQITTTQTAYLENKFKYIQNNSGGYVNSSAFILKYQDLFVVEVED